MFDSDRDGISNSDDRCPDEPEDFDDFEDNDGCPDYDNDRDGILDINDRCRDEAGVADNVGCPMVDSDRDGINDKLDKCPRDPEDKDDFQDSDGCPDPDNDRDSVPDAADACPSEPGHPANKGCPMVDSDEDGIADRQDKCPTDPEDLDGFEDEDGCPEQATAAVPDQKPIALAGGTIVAVFDIHDASNSQKRSTMEQLTEYLAAQMTSNGYRVVPRNQIRERLIAEARGSYSECFDQSCQIELGRALSAQMSLDTKLLKLGRQCIINSTLFELRSQTAVRASQAKVGCKPEQLMAGVDEVCAGLTE